MIKRYFRLKSAADTMVRNGTPDLDPKIRSIMRQLAKIYAGLASEDKRIVDFKEEVELQMGC